MKWSLELKLKNEAATYENLECRLLQGQSIDIGKHNHGFSGLTYSERIAIDSTDESAWDLSSFLSDLYIILYILVCTLCYDIPFYFKQGLSVWKSQCNISLGENSTVFLYIRWTRHCFCISYREKSWWNWTNICRVSQRWAWVMQNSMH